MASPTVSARDLHGLMAMMPAWATPNAADIDATNTVDLDNLRDGVNRIIGDGIDVLTTTGSYGEFHTLLWDEYETLIRATVEVVARRVPLFVGTTSLNSRDVVRRMRLAREVGADGVLLGVPFYFPSTVENAIRFFQDIGAMFPDLAIMVYHNPDLHNIVIPPGAFRQLVQVPNIVAMKDSHRDTRQLMALTNITGDRVSIFVNTTQYYPYKELGAAGLWSHEAWMGPWPALAVRNAVDDGDSALARQVIADMAAGPGLIGQGPSIRVWLETMSKISAGYAGYCQPGPLRPPFVVIPPEVQERAKARADYWLTLCEKYRPTVEARQRTADPLLAGA